MKALSIRQPWAWLIVNGFKDIENRSWNTKYRGPLLIHAAKGMTVDEYEFCFLYARDRLILLPTPQALPRGGIVGIADIVGVTDKPLSRWFMGPLGFELANQKPLPFVPYRGALGLFDVPDEVTA